MRARLEPAAREPRPGAAIVNAVNTTTLILRDVIQQIEKRRYELDSAHDLRSIVITVRMKTGITPPQIQYSTTSVELGGSNSKA